MKKFKNPVALVMVLILGVGIHLAAANSVKTEIRNLRDFHSITVSSGIDLFLKTAGKEEVKVVANENSINKIITEVKDGVLKIYIKGNNNFKIWELTKPQKVYVSVKELQMLDVSSGSAVYSENTLIGESLKVSVSSGSDVNLKIQYTNFKLDTSSGSDAQISGKTKNFEASASSGSDIKAQNLESVTCFASASSGSDITVNVSGELHASASSGSDIRYHGNPKIRDINKSSGGDVTRK